MALERTAERRDFGFSLRRVSWGAIFSGATLAVAIMVVLGTLGLAIGATTVDPGPTGDSPSPRALGIGAGIWWLVSGVLALLAGGWAAGRLAGMRRNLEGPLHGAVTWALTTVASLVLVTTIVGMLISGAFRVVGATASVAVSGTQAIASQVAPSDVAWNQVWSEAQQLLQQTEAPELQPENLRESAQGAAREARTTDLQAALAKLRSSASEIASAADQDAAFNVLVARTGMSEREARRTVEGWSRQLQSARQAASSGASKVRGATMAAAGQAVDAVAGAAWWMFAYFLLTAAAAALGGFLGAPNGRRGRERNPPRTVTRRPPPATSTAETQTDQV